MRLEAVVRYSSLMEEKPWMRKDNDLEKLYKKFLNNWKNYFTEEEYQRRLEEAACQRMKNAMMMNVRR